jgi:hypothetical protein
MSAISMSRRQALLGAASLAGGAGLTSWPASQSLARAPLATDQAPYFYRFKHGNMQGTVISDGILPLGDPAASFLGASKEEIAKMLTDNFLPPNSATLEQNILVLNTGDRLVLFDTGMGTSQMFGTTTGKMLAVVVMLVGIGFIAILTGAIAERFLSPDVEREESEIEAVGDQVLGKLGDVEARLTALEAALDRRAD